ncbi:TonB-dependent receptor plug domain-containing protein, partial [Anabaena sp. CCY 9614]
TLVLVNGKRRHRTALINSVSTLYNGSVGVDLNMLPSSAISRVEVLRDGAAAQYGSDAVAGVINVILNKSAEGGQ